MTPRATGDNQEWCRKGSRACTFEMCNSITGTLAPLIASCRAIDVCVYAPALKTTPSIAPLAHSRPASWIQWIDTINFANTRLKRFPPGPVFFLSIGLEPHGRHGERSVRADNHVAIFVRVARIALVFLRCLLPAAG